MNLKPPSPCECSACQSSPQAGPKLGVSDPHVLWFVWIEDGGIQCLCRAFSRDGQMCWHVLVVAWHIGKESLIAKQASDVGEAVSLVMAKCCVRRFDFGMRVLHRPFGHQHAAEGGQYDGARAQSSSDLEKQAMSFLDSPARLVIKSRPKPGVPVAPCGPLSPSSQKTEVVMPSLEQLHEAKKSSTRIVSQIKALLTTPGVMMMDDGDDYGDGEELADGLALLDTGNELAENLDVFEANLTGAAGTAIHAKKGSRMSMNKYTLTAFSASAFSPLYATIPSALVGEHLKVLGM